MNIKPDFIFETSWEICNKIGGIYTVISTKAKSIVDEFQDNYVLIGPDVWKETTNNPDFIEDPTLFEEWKVKAWKEGLKVRTGRWNIEGSPLVILVDFTPLFSKKDEIFAHFWETYKLDSLHGEWDYIESTIFGYAAGQVIESFQNYYLPHPNNVVAHFHEWMTGAGVLYLKNKAPHISTAFTTHATVLGRSIAGNGFPLYENIKQYQPDRIAREFNVISKHSLELLSAKEADVTTTVSQITAKECNQFFGIKPSIITTNGFEEDFVPTGKQFDKKRIDARKKALEIASEHTGTSYPEDTILLITSGRYEYINKGIDLFIKSLSNIQKNKLINKNIVAFITVPAGHHKPIVSENGNFNGKNRFLTHQLHDPDNDPIINEIKTQGFTNDSDNNVHIIFAPVYLDGNDGVINLSYYNFLIGFDLSVFPSYYEPWGYTPLESIAFRVPTITTNYAGFGDWVNINFDLKYDSVCVIERHEGNDEKAIKEIQNIIQRFANLNSTIEIRNETNKVLSMALWKQMAINYFKAWELAIEKSEKRKINLPTKKYTETLKIDGAVNSEKPEWKKILVQNKLPDVLKPLKELAYNLWWSWNYEATNMFAEIDSGKWKAYENNPVRLVESLSKEEIDGLQNDHKFITLLNKVTTNFKNYMSQADDKPQEMIAYFSMEYGLHNSIKIFSGGLGILAGDYLKQASDSNKNMVAVGLLYRYGYFNQELSIFGDQQARYKAQKFTQLPLIPVRKPCGDWLTVLVALPGRTITAKVWQINVGRIPLYLLDTDIDINSTEDRAITAQLYGGDNEHRLKQELLLGLGGVRLLEGIGLKPTVFHSNEGHSAFSGLERIKNIIEKHNVDFNTAKELVRANTLFTTHTPVPAGHDTFEEHLIRAYLSHFSDIFKISWEQFMALGRHNISNSNEKFSMSLLAAGLSQEINGVSKIHGRVSRQMFSSLYPGYFPEEIHIGHVTNGVHYFTWTDELWQKLYKENFDKDFESNQSDQSAWKNILNVPDEQIWQTRLSLKKKLVEAIKEKLKKDLTRRQESPSVILNSMAGISEETLIVGFARRFATYKRAHLLFTDLERLSQIINNNDRPIIFIFSGKAHPNDKAGQDLIKRIIEVSKMKDFIGKILFLENYDMISGKLLTSSVDIWLNTPTRPLEASGTSGEKAVMNGVANFSVLDGWWAEGYKPDAGWAIEEAKTFANQQFQDELDAQIIYNTFENEIAAIYYDKNSAGVSEKWVSYIKNTIAKVAPHFTMQRMLEDYYNKYYSPLFDRRNELYANKFAVAKSLVAWKSKVQKSWENISLDSLIVPDADNKPLEFGKHFVAEITLNIPGLEPADIGAEIVMGNKSNGDVKKIDFKSELKLSDAEDGKAKFKCEFPLEHTGVYDYAFRIFPKNSSLRYRMDFPLVKWI
ncbi:MAG: alpha-glucan family phosphorylase [Bacteroidetes bacterium]|nr:alpha-glucan family phosphorylase [Bacteroidota bacterium]MBL6943974.1 alpha-glucan family phosphorylase [Bacteroidales bacterium]